MVRVALIIIAGIISGILAKKYNLPGGAVVGAMLGSGVVAVILPGSFSIPEGGSTAIQVILGVSLGMTFDRSYLPMLARILPVAVFSTIVLLGVSILLAILVNRFGWLDFSTAMFGFSPGGMSGMSLLAQAEGYSTATVSFIHTVRIFTLFLVVPLIGRILWFRTL
jgi:membrane AbrB-like protein